MRSTHSPWEVAKSSYADGAYDPLLGDNDDANAERNGAGRHQIDKSAGDGIVETTGYGYPQQIDFRIRSGDCRFRFAAALVSGALCCGGAGVAWLIGLAAS